MNENVEKNFCLPVSLASENSARRFRSLKASCKLPVEIE